MAEMEYDLSSDTRPDVLLDLRRYVRYQTTLAPIGGDYNTKEFLASDGGHRYVKHFNPTPDIVKPLLRKTKEPSVLLLRGCALLLQPVYDFPFYKFKSLISLEISSIPHLSALPDNAVSQMAQLESLHLSSLPVLKQLPDHLFTNLVELRSIVIRDCSSLQFLPEPQTHLSKLEFLDLSQLPIQTLPVGFISKGLSSLILRECSKLDTLPAPSFGILSELLVLDLFQCTSLHTSGIVADSLRVLDLSYTTNLVWSDFTEKSYDLTYISHRNAKGSKTIDLELLSSMELCDLSGCQHVTDVTGLFETFYLKVLDLSRTNIESLSGMLGENLRILILRECSRLQQLPEFDEVVKLQVLDISGCVMLYDLPKGLCNQKKLKELNLSGCSGIRELSEGLFDKMSCLERLVISETNFEHLPSVPNPETLIIRDKPGHELVGSTGMSRNNRGNSDPHEFHLVSTFITGSGFDQFRLQFTDLNNHITELESDCVVKRQFQSMRSDLQYILYRLEELEISENCTSCEKLLSKLVDYRHVYRDHIGCSRELNKLLRVVAKLKILFKRRPSKKFNVREDNKEKIMRRITLRDLNSGSIGRILENDYLKQSYESLTNLQRNCLLYFACLSILEWENSSVHDILQSCESPRETTLIHLWYAEGFLDPLLNASPNQQLSTTIQYLGRQVLQVLKQLFKIEIEEGEEKGWYVPQVSFCFLRSRVKESQLFDVDQNGKHTPHFNVSQRACLVKADVNKSMSSSSSQLWLNYTNSSTQLETFKSVRTLLYIDEDVVEINTKWFSMMENLSVLHLANLGPAEQIRIVDVKFLEELKKMKQLKLISLEGFSVINELPSSICVLTNLEILKLEHCSHLEKLPADIGSLVNLFYLDMTQCHLLSEVPKGIASLPKLEVLKGFPITYEVDGKQSRKACTLKELLKLDKLRKLKIVVNKNTFPCTRDLEVFKDIQNLCNLSITWKKDYNNKGDEPQEALRYSRWQQLKCWNPRALHNEVDEDDDDDDNEELRRNCLGNLEKLVLCCFPLETAPTWLQPNGLQKLERLHLVGGNLKALSGDDTSQTIWKVKTLHLKYMSKFDMDWPILKGTFPDMTYFNGKGSPCIQNVPDVENCVVSGNLKGRPGRSGNLGVKIIK